MAHIYTVITEMADYIEADIGDVALAGMPLIYMNVTYPNTASFSFRSYRQAHELLADLMQYVVMKDAKADVESGELANPHNLFSPSNLTSDKLLIYWHYCAWLTPVIDYTSPDPAPPTAADESFIRAVLAGEFPTWFTDRYDGITESELFSRSASTTGAVKLWKDIREFQRYEVRFDSSLRLVPVNYFSTLFGGYCDNAAATNEARRRGTPPAGRNPWANGGCALGNPGGIVLEAGTGYIDINWDNSRSIDTALVDEIEIQWKASGEDYSDDIADGRTATVTQSQLPYRISSTAGTELTIRLRLVSGRHDSNWVEKTATVGS